ncbi:MAG: dihydrodipicolinate synthase family protein [Bryobacteraceae bacterium]
MASTLGGSLPVIPTPFSNDRIDFDSLSRLFDHLFPELDGCTICGSTGESVSLSIEERLELMRFAARNTPAGKSVVVGLTHTNLDEMIRLAHTAEELGLQGGLVPCPYYFPNSLGMVVEFFRALDRATSLPLVFYDNPVYTKTWLSAEQVLEVVHSCEHMVGVKMTDHALEKISVIKNAGVSVYAGDDVTAFRSLLLGVSGSMIIAPAVFPQSYQETARLLKAGNAAGALRVFSQRVLPFIHLFGPGDEVQVTKALFRHIRIFRSNETRLPLLPCTPERLNHVLLAYELCLAGNAIAEPA